MDVVKTITVPVTEFKANCLKLLEQMNKTGNRLVVTKRGKPLARVEPLQMTPKSPRGMWAGRVEFVGRYCSFLHG